MSGLVHKCSKGRTFLVRQWRKVRVNVDAGATAWMLCELDASHEAAEYRCAGSFRVAFPQPFNLAERLREEKACSAVTLLT